MVCVASTLKCRAPRAPGAGGARRGLPGHAGGVCFRRVLNNKWLSGQRAPGETNIAGRGERQVLGWDTDALVPLWPGFVVNRWFHRSIFNFAVFSDAKEVKVLRKIKKKELVKFYKVPKPTYLFTSTLEQRLVDKLTVIKTVEELDEQCDRLVSCMKQYETACPLSKVRKKNVPWWNKELTPGCTMPTFTKGSL